MLANSIYGQLLIPHGLEENTKGSFGDALGVGTNSTPFLCCSRFVIMGFRCCLLRGSPSSGSLVMVRTETADVLFVWVFDGLCSSASISAPSSLLQIDFARFHSKRKTQYANMRYQTLRCRVIKYETGRRTDMKVG